MKNIRFNVFETNSSSSHSISISNTRVISLNNSCEILETIIPDDNGVVYLEGGEFGWENLNYHDALSKANYCLIDSIGNQNKLEMLISVIKEVTGAKEVNIDNVNGYIDHQSEGTSNKAFSSKETLKNFIFNRDSILPYW